MGYQPWRIKISSKEEINDFLTTVSLCFNISIELSLQNKEGNIEKLIFNLCTVLQTIHISSRPTVSNDSYFEMWISSTALTKFMSQQQQKVSCVHFLSCVINAFLNKMLPLTCHTCEKCSSISQTLWLLTHTLQLLTSTFSFTLTGFFFNYFYTFYIYQGLHKIKDGKKIFILKRGKVSEWITKYCITPEGKFSMPSSCITSLQGGN